MLAFVFIHNPQECKDFRETENLHIKIFTCENIWEEYIFWEREHHSASPSALGCYNTMQLFMLLCCVTMLVFTILYHFRLQRMWLHADLIFLMLKLSLIIASLWPRRIMYTGLEGQVVQARKVLHIHSLLNRTRYYWLCAHQTRMFKLCLM